MTSEMPVISTIQLTAGLNQLGEKIRKVHEQAEQVAKILDGYREEGVTYLPDSQVEHNKEMLRRLILMLSVYVESWMIVRGLDASELYLVDLAAENHFGFKFEELTAALI